MKPSAGGRVVAAPAWRLEAPRELFSWLLEELWDAAKGRHFDGIERGFEPQPRASFWVVWLSTRCGATSPYVATNRNAANLGVHATGGRA
jgi:hypothetical protein